MPYPSTVAQLESRITALATTFSAICTRSDLSETTHEGRKVSLLRIGTGTGEGRPRILITAGVHAREWAPPDAVLTFLEKLLDAYTPKKKPAVYTKFEDKRSAPSILYKEFAIPVPDIERIIERTELYVIPLVNPDGRAYTMPPKKVRGWRKNRRQAPPGVTCPAVPPGDPEDPMWVPPDPAGVDVNRNFNFAFADSYYSPAAETASGGHDPCDQTFHGPTGGSEPETKNVQNTITGKQVKFFLDVHSFAAKFLFAWALAENQDTDDTKTFKNTALDRAGASGGRDPRALPPYKEWVPKLIIKEHLTLGDTMAAAVLDSTGYSATEAATNAVAKAARDRSQYTAVQAVFQHGGTTPVFYAGASRDFAFSQQIGSTPGPPIRAGGGDPVLSFTFECGRTEDGGFQPHATKHYPKVEREVAAALAAFLRFVATWTAPVPPPPPPPPPPPTGTPKEKTKDCFFAIAAYGSALYPQLRFLYDLRDCEVKATDLGRRFLGVVERVYYSFSPRVAKCLNRHSALRRLARLAVVAPTVGLIRGCAALVRSMEPRERRVRWLLGLITGSGVAVLGAILAAVVYLAGRAIAGW